jgi:hypothetical protein
MRRFFVLIVGGFALLLLYAVVALRPDHMAPARRPTPVPRVFVDPAPGPDDYNVLVYATDDDLRTLPDGCHFVDHGPMIVDSKARVCSDRGFVRSRGCCLPSLSSPNPCKLCHRSAEPLRPRQFEDAAPTELAGRCCAEYEACVACCLQAGNTWVRCPHECRTSSLSLDEHQRYREGAYHHCFDQHASLQELEDFEELALRHRES